MPCSRAAGDSNYDNRVDLADFGALKGYFGLPSGAAARQGDFDGNGRVDLADFGVLKQNFGEEAIGARPPSAQAHQQQAAIVAAAADAAFAADDLPHDRRPLDAELRWPTQSITGNDRGPLGSSGV